MVPNNKDVIFVELNSKELENVRGGNPALGLIITGGAAFASWASTPGNGVFVNADGRRGTADDIYIGRSAFQQGGDPNGWRWGIKNGGNWFLGGYNTKGNWVVDRIKQLAGRR